MCECKGGDGKGTNQMTITSTIETQEKHQQEVDEQVRSCPGGATWIS